MRPRAQKDDVLCVVTSVCKLLFSVPPSQKKRFRAKQQSPNTQAPQAGRGIYDNRSLVPTSRRHTQHPACAGSSQPFDKMLRPPTPLRPARHAASSGGEAPAGAERRARRVHRRNVPPLR